MKEEKHELDLISEYSRGFGATGGGGVKQLCRERSP